MVDQELVLRVLKSQRQGLENQRPNRDVSHAGRRKPFRPYGLFLLITYRQRRIKCDESRPHCQRCRSFGVICDGFTPKSGGTAAPMSERRVFAHLRPKPQLQLPRCAISAVRFENEQELRFFRLFQQETASKIQIAGPLKSSLWGRLVPQTSESKPFVRHAMIAIAAMSKFSRDARNLQLLGQDGGQNESLNWERQYALKHYGKALKGIRDASAHGEHDLRTSLIACLLVFCFEVLQGSERHARSLALSGLSLFHQWDSKRNMKSTAQYRSLLMLDVELLSAFVSLDIQVLFFPDDRPLSMHQQIIDATTETLKTMPSKFARLEEANCFWQVIIRRGLHVKAKAESYRLAAELRSGPGSLPQSADLPTGHLRFSQLKQYSPEIERECQICITDIYKWTKAASEVFGHVTRTDHNWTVIAALLQIHAKATLIVLAGMTFTDETSFDVFLPDFRAITNLAVSIHPQLVESSKKSGIHHVDLGIIPALYLVGARCRDKIVRARAIDLLYSTPYREGIWDSIAVAKVSSWLRSIEVAAGGAEDHIPGCNRVVSASTNLDLFNRTAKVYCTQRNGPADTDLVSHDAFLSW